MSIAGGDTRVPLSALSARQRRLMERHLPLVHLVLRRHPRLARLRPAGRDRAELFQEGCLALAEAIRSHDPRRHVHFAAFAMARIRFAMSTYSHEQAALIRVPFITQRRWKARRMARADRHRPMDPAPRVIPVDRLGMLPAGRLAREQYPERAFEDRGRPSVGDLLRAGYDRARCRAVARLKRSPECTRAVRAALDRCSQERWAIPDPQARSSLAGLAAAAGTSPSRINHYEERFRRIVAEILQADAAFVELRRWQRSRPEGLHYRPTPEEMVHLQALREASRESLRRWVRRCRLHLRRRHRAARRSLRCNRGLVRRTRGRRGLDRFPDRGTERPSVNQPEAPARENRSAAAPPRNIRTMKRGRLQSRSGLSVASPRRLRAASAERRTSGVNAAGSRTSVPARREGRRRTRA